MIKKLLFLSLVGALFSGCALGPTPQNAAEYRKGILKGGFGTSFKTYVVNRSYKKSVKILRRQTKKCLQVKVRSQSCVRNTTFGSSCSTTIITYRPKVMMGKKRTTLQVQVGRDPDNSIYLGGKPPKGGMIMAIIDLLPAKKRKTKVNVYSPSLGSKLIPKAVKHWLNGTNRGCPKLTGR